MIPSSTNFQIRLDTQEKPGPIRNVAVIWFLLIFPQYFLVVLLDYEGLSCIPRFLLGSNSSL